MTDADSAAAGGDELVFRMGEFPAAFPTNRRYAKNHMWALGEGPVLRFGLAAYAVRLLQDVYFLEWTVDPGTVVVYRQEIGSIESKKAESALYAPAAGRIVRFNDRLLEDPSGINVDKYGAGWLFEIETDGSGLLEPSAYLAHLDDVWEVTQRTIKGQMNE
jgi:glycine cleavage system H protein